MTGRAVFDVLDAFLTMFSQQRALFLLMATKTGDLLEVVVDMATRASLVVIVIEFEIRVMIETCRPPRGIAMALPTGAIQLLV